MPTLDPGRDVHGPAGPLRWFLPKALMQTMPVVVVSELSQDLTQMPLAEDQQVIEGLGPGSPRDCTFLGALLHRFARGRQGG